MILKGASLGISIGKYISYFLGDLSKIAKHAGEGAAGLVGSVAW